MTYLKRLYFLTLCYTITIADYWSERELALRENELLAIGSNIELTEKERAVNEVLMNIKYEELKEGFDHPEYFPPAQHFFQSKSKIEYSEVFKFLKKMPKGGMLHGKDMRIVSDEFIFRLTYKDNLYGCWHKGLYRLRFFNGTTTNECNWELLSDIRKYHEEKFNEFLRFQLSMKVPNPYEAYPTSSSALDKYSKVTATLDGLLKYEPVLYEYLHEAKRVLQQENIMYVETTYTLMPVYNLNGTIDDELDVAKILFNEYTDYVKESPGLTGKMIYSPLGITDNTTMDKQVRIYLKLKENYNAQVAGFDLTALDNSENLIVNFLPQIRVLKENSAKLFYNNDLTAWFDEYTNANLVDAVLLNSTRIGNPRNIVKNQFVTKMIDPKRIGIEITPIKDQVMRTVDNMKNHPAGNLIARGHRVIITSGDSSYWGAEGVTYDWYMVFMGIADLSSDLRFLKQLAINSLLSTGMDETELENALQQFYSDWDKFIDEVYSNNIEPVTSQ